MKTEIHSCQGERYYSPPPDIGQTPQPLYECVECCCADYSNDDDASQQVQCQSQHSSTPWVDSGTCRSGLWQHGTSQGVDGTWVQSGQGRQVWLDGKTAFGGYAWQGYFQTGHV